MTRGLTPAVAAAIAAPVVPLALAAKFEFDTGHVRLWTGVHDLTLLGEVYTGAGQFLSASGVRESSEVRADGVTLTLSGLDASIISVALAENYQGRPATLYFVAFDAAGAVLPDPVGIYRGRMDTMEIEEGGSSATISLAVESNLIDLDRPRERRYTPEDQKADFPGDLGFDFVTVIQDKEVVWR